MTISRVAQWRVEISFDGVQEITNEIYRFLDDEDGIETTAIVLPDEKQKLLKPPLQGERGKS